MGLAFVPYINAEALHIKNLKCLAGSRIFVLTGIVVDICGHIVIAVVHSPLAYPVDNPRSIGLYIVGYGSALSRRQP